MVDPIQKLTKSTKIVERLRNDILDGYFAPGDQLQMDVLKQRYLVGYSPLREALSRLVCIGLVLFEEHCGFRVAPLSLEDLHDLYKIRMHIETMALELSIEHGDDLWEADVISCWHRYSKFMKNDEVLDPHIWNAFEKEFRSSLIKACKSPWLLKMQKMLYENAARYRYLCLGRHNADQNIILEYVHESEQLVTAVLARDKIKAVQISHQMWQSSLNIMNKELLEQKTLLLRENEVVNSKS